jgi:8-oxo-dGTP diphosphatase
MTGAVRASEVAEAMAPDDDLLDCVAFLLIQDDRILLERRGLTKLVVPGVLAIPGGHMEQSESPEEAVERELHEELGVVSSQVRYVCTLLHRSQEFRRLHYFAVTAWDGAVTAREAAALEWVEIRHAPTFDLDVDRLAVSEYLRLYRPGSCP